MSMNFLGECVTCNAKVLTNIHDHHKFHQELVAHMFDGRFYCCNECKGGGTS